MLEDSDVRRWHGNLARGSVVTDGMYLRRLGWFCEKCRLTSKGLAAMDQRELENLLLDLVESWRGEGKNWERTAQVLLHPHLSIPRKNTDTKRIGAQVQNQKPLFKTHRRVKRQGSIPNDLGPYRL